MYTCGHLTESKDNQTQGVKMPFVILPVLLGVGALVIAYTAGKNSNEPGDKSSSSSTWHPKGEFPARPGF